MAIAEMIQGMRFQQDKALVMGKGCNRNWRIRFRRSSELAPDTIENIFMRMASRLRFVVKDVGNRTLPDALYFRIYRALFLLGNKLRRGSNTRFEVMGQGLYRATDPDSTSIFFCERTRFRLFHYPKGVRGRIEQVSCKYQCDDIEVRQGDIVIDIGANIGEFTMAVSNMAERVISIEPDPNVHEALSHNTAGLQNVLLYQLALSSSEGEANFYLSTKDADSSLVEPEEFTEVIKVGVCTLDALVEEAGLERVDFLKIEAEGWEPEILAGAARTLAITRHVAVDAGPERQGMATADDVKTALSAAGFDVFQRGYVVFASRQGLTRS